MDKKKMLLLLAMGLSLAGASMFMFTTFAVASFMGRGGNSSADAGSGAATSCDGLENLPEQFYSDTVCAAALKHKIDPAFGMAILWVENRGLYQPASGELKTPKDPTKVNWACSNMGACGPAQFMPATWGSYGEDGKKINPGDGGDDGKATITAWSDAVFSSAKYLKAAGAGTTMNEAKVRDVACNYNAGPAGNCNNPETLPYMDLAVQAWKRFGGG